MRTTTPFLLFSIRLSGLEIIEQKRELCKPLVVGMKPLW
jgi:hypothetical protein